MSRRLLGMTLLLSVGVNLGILVMVFLRTAPPPAPGPPPDPVVEPMPVGEPPPVGQPRDEEPADAPADPASDPTRPEPVDRPPVTPEPREPPLRDPDRPPPPGGRTPADRGVGQSPAVGLRLDRLSDELGLEGSPRERFNQIQREFLSSAWHVRGSLRIAEAEMRRELFAPEPDRARLAEIQGRIEASRSELETLLIDTVLRSRELLDPAQEAIYIRVIGRLRQAALSAPPQAGQQLRRQQQRPDRAPVRRRPWERNQRRPPG
jgi:hypothetical protein